ncbi:glutathione S-transferase family protein [Aureimonas leprariae]|uniref:Glutathione S-transferase family protein n=1 Tax=Plantimonas leprariae TaxID=2615207 RepID=A0A7V7PPA1_9HYPH|nr:glutathione S-transferase family protein [Aureimonas leprariae]KAB0679777.1 glutathione S-transferase family protein [Aureimonas leprariae]
MADGTLFIGTKRYSSWSLRGWLAVHFAGLDVEEVVIPLAGGATPEVKAKTPAGFVPYLEHDGAHIWDSLAICEYCAEFAPGLWPEDRAHRALLRSASAEMHSGFAGLRKAFPHIAGPVASAAARDRQMTDEARADIARIVALWDELLKASGGPFLHGPFMGIADAMFAPVAVRFRTWALDVPAQAAAYVGQVHDHPLVRRWFAEAEQEPAEWRLEGYETKVAG